MTKRRLRLRLTEYPQIIEGLRQQAARFDGEHADDDPWWPDLHREITDGDLALWWVTEPMARLARAYAPDLPDWDFAAVRPAAAGVIIWDGSSGLETGIPARGDRPAWRATVQGVFWGMYDMQPVLLPLVRSTDTPLAPDEKAGVLCFGPVFLLTDENAAHTMMQMIGTTLILAQTPTVVTRHDQRMPRAGGMRQTRPGMPMAVTQIVLREAVRHADAVRADEEKSGKKWTLTHRHLVRGHWRQQACGPNLQWRKPTFVPPYIKGPADGDLRLTQDVHVWRR